jgi:hypothetical protein
MARSHWCHDGKEDVRVPFHTGTCGDGSRFTLVGSSLIRPGDLVFSTSQSADWPIGRDVA